MMLTRVGAVVTCVTLAMFLLMIQPPGNAAQTQQSQQSNIYTQQAVTQVQVTEQAAAIAELKTKNEALTEELNVVRVDLGNIRGMGIGATLLLAAFQSLQMIFQIKATKKS